MSAMIESDTERQERLWRERRDKGQVNTISPHSGVIDWRTIPELMDEMRNSAHPFTPLLERLADDLVEKHGGRA